MRFLWLLLAITVPQYAPAQKLPDSKDAAYAQLERFVEVLETVRNSHPDLEKLSYERLINFALDGMLSSLDAHSSFIHPEMGHLVSQGSDEINNDSKSLGLSLGKNSDGYFISSIEQNGPAHIAKLIAGTSVISINEQIISDTPFPEVMQLLHGLPGELVHLKLRNPERPGDLDVTLSHRYVEQKSIVTSFLLRENPTIGYLRLASFGPGCAREVENALDALEDNGMKYLVLDLRENGGGDLNETVGILGLFVPPSTAVVSVREREKPEKFLKTSKRQRRKRTYPISVLIDRNSASASELTAGSLHDLKRASVVGEKSYGKGSVQTIVPMGNGSALRLTIATYHTPSGKTPHLVGITPDTEIVFSDGDRENFRNNGRLDTLPEAEKNALEKWQDPAIQAAVEVLLRQ
ncbi:S41 family peptidase [Luteolibacter algae]